MPQSPNYTLLTDLYQLTMSYSYWKTGMAEREAVFHLFFRRAPFGGSYAVACGLEAAASLMEQFHFGEEDLRYLSELQGNDGKPLFEAAFLAYLGGLRFTCSVDAPPEGTLVFAHEPLLRIRGPVILCQLLETPLLSLINFETLIATKASRVCYAAGGDAVLEFGLRRAQGANGGLSASRAAYVGGVAATSNVLAGRAYGIPVRGTHAHSWVMSFDTEQEAFAAYAHAMPNNSIFLVDTYDTIRGVAHAIREGERLRDKGYRLGGIRLDSGDLCELSIRARQMLDAAGFGDAAIVASNDLDEYEITDLKSRGAKITVWGVGTRLATAYDQPALGGVYKLAAIREPGGDWKYRIKLSEQAIKVSNPGIQQVRRFSGPEGQFIGDMIYDTEAHLPSAHFTSFEGLDIQVDDAAYEDILQPIFAEGNRVTPPADIHASRGRTLRQLTLLPANCLLLKQASAYPVGLSPELRAKKAALMQSYRPLNP